MRLDFCRDFVQPVSAVEERIGWHPGFSKLALVAVRFDEEAARAIALRSTRADGRRARPGRSHRALMPPFFPEVS